MKKKVMVGMSGGVDSSVAAAVLLEQGYEVYGVTMQIWPEHSQTNKEHDNSCCSLFAVEDARTVANKLNIPYYVLNLKNEFKTNVIDYFTSEYISGRTPNPCIACNRFVKFEALLNKAISMGMDYIATGHYARIEHDSQKGRYLLKKSATDRKDQTYALYTLTQFQLSHTLMPIGEFTKEQVRKKAEELGLNVASKPDSQEICFIDDDDYAGYICSNTDYVSRPGYFKDVYGNVLGMHKGIIHYTIGQRKGLGIALGKPMFVVDIEPDTNTVILGDSSQVFSSSLEACDVNFISIDKLASEMKVKAKIRYSAKEADAVISPMPNGCVKVVFEQPQRAITPGQSVVFYDGDIVVGGGIINKKL